jgi:hypothetical protein
MAFNPRDLSVLAYANGFTLWLYKTRDRLLDLDENSYFDPAAELLAHGDMIMVTASDGAKLVAASVGSGGCRLAPLN